MSRPPGPHSARAPAGSTALPGLIPDLVARIPCEFWDLWKGSGDGLAGRVAAAVHGCLSGPSLCSPRPAPRAPLGAHSHRGRGCVLVVSCLLCVVFCCCCGRHRKEPRDEEAVGLGSARSTINTHLVRSGHQLGQCREAAQGPGSGASSAPSMVWSAQSGGGGATWLARR